MGVKCKQSPLGNQQIRQAKQREELHSILGQSTIACLLMSEAVLHDMKRVLNLGPDAGLLLLDPFAQSPALGVRQRTALTRPQGYLPDYVSVPVLFPLFNALIACITEHRRLFTVQ